MTQEEFIKKYKGKNIELYTTPDREIGWIFNVQEVDFSKGNEIFLGWIKGEKVIIGVPGKIEVYNGEVILRPEDKIEVYDNLEGRISEYLKNNIL